MRSARLQFVLVHRIDTHVALDDAIEQGHSSATCCASRGGGGAGEEFPSLVSFRLCINHSSVFQKVIMVSRALSCFTVFLLSSCLSLAGAADLRISMAQPMASDTHGVWYKLSRAIAREWNEGTVFFLSATTFEKSVENVVSGKADVHFPLMQSPARADEELPFRYSSFTTSETPFALYVPKGSDLVQRKNLTIATLSKRRIETEMAHAGLFFSSLKEVGSIETGLRRASTGQSDGFLFSAHSTDAVWKRLKLENLVRVPYRRVQDRMVLPKGPAGEELDEKVGFIIDRLKDSGEYQRIMAPKLKEPDSQ